MHFFKNEEKMTNKHFNEYKTKLTLEAILKAALCGIGVGFGAGLILAIVFYFVGIDLIGILIAAPFVVAALAGTVFYLLLFRPNDVTNARRLDRLGLEERLITMVELEGDESYIAKIQREDAKASLAGLDKSKLEIKLPGKLIAFALTLFILGTAMITVNVLAKLGFMKYGNEIIEDYILDELVDYVTVIYEAEDGGTIDGDEIQDIVKGFDTSVVTAVADDGYMFKEWSDGYTNPTRYDQKINESITFTAIFIELEDEEGEEGEGGSGDSDKFGDQPGGESNADGDGNQGGGQEGPPNPNATTGGGQRNPNNQVIDGNTFYKELLEYYQELVAGEIEDNGGLTEEEIDLIKKYLGIV